MDKQRLEETMATIEMLEPEQFIHEPTREGISDRIVLWSQSPKMEVLKDGTRVKMFEEDGVTPIMETKVKKIKEGHWKFKTLCDLMAQREYFANLRLKKSEK